MTVQLNNLNALLGRQRRALNMTQRDVASRRSVSYSAQTKIEQAENITWASASDMARAMGCVLTATLTPLDGGEPLTISSEPSLYDDVRRQDTRRLVTERIAYQAGVDEDDLPIVRLFISAALTHGMRLLDEDLDAAAQQAYEMARDTNEPVEETPLSYRELDQQLRRCLGRGADWVLTRIVEGGDELRDALQIGVGLSSESGVEVGVLRSLQGYERSGLDGQVGLRFLIQAVTNALPNNLDDMDEWLQFLRDGKPGLRAIQRVAILLMDETLARGLFDRIGYALPPMRSNTAAMRAK